MQLIATVAAHRAKDITRRTRGVHTHQNRFLRGHVALDQGNVLQAIALLAERNQAEVPVEGRHIHLLALLHNRLLLQAVGDQVSDRNQLDIVLVSHLTQLRQASHCAIVIHNLHQCGGRVEARQTTHIHASLRMARTTQHALLLCVERVDMAGATKGLRGRGRISQRTDRSRAISR